MDWYEDKTGSTPSSEPAPDEEDVFSDGYVSNSQERNTGRGGEGKKERVGDRQNTRAKGQSQVVDKGSRTACKWNQDCCSTVVGLSFLRFTTASHSAGKVFCRGSSSVCQKKNSSALAKRQFQLSLDLLTRLRLGPLTYVEHRGTLPNLSFEISMKSLINPSKENTY